MAVTCNIDRRDKLLENSSKFKPMEGKTDYTRHTFDPSTAEKQIINYFLHLQDKGSSLGCSHSTWPVWDHTPEEHRGLSLKPYFPCTHTSPPNIISHSHLPSLDHSACVWPSTSTLLGLKRDNQPHMQHGWQDEHSQVFQSCWPTHSSHWFTFCP